MTPAIRTQFKTTDSENAAAKRCFGAWTRTGVVDTDILFRSGLTHAGFLAGARSFGWQVPVHGICVRRNADLQYDRIMQRTNEVSQLLGGDGVTHTNDVLVDDAVLAPGYGQLNAQVMKAMSDSAQLEALLLDPVYSGRTMAGLISLVNSGTIQAGETVLFIHTGGLASLFAYQTELTNGKSRFSNLHH